jgi:GDP-L-fucose synthase
MHILVTGATGFLGRHTLPVLRKAYPDAKVSAVASKDYDLMSLDVARTMIAELKPDVIVHYAAYSGGIGANRAYPADFYFRNTLLTANVFQAAAEAKVGKLIYTMGGCSYPAKATSPIDESQLWNGYPQNESAGYSTAKMMGTVASRSYRDQYGLNSIVLIPGNMYGEYDNFSTLDSHVVPAFVRRYYEAMREGRDEVVMWGTGIAQRDFVYAADVAKLIPWFIDNYNSSEPVNISAGTTTSIRELATTIAELVDYKGQIVWDDTKPDGQLVKIFSVERLKSLGLSCDTPLRAGLKPTIDWFGHNYDTRSDGLRL